MSLWANDECQAQDEKNLHARQGRVRGTCTYSSKGTHVSKHKKCPIEEEHDTEEHEQHTKQDQRNNGTSRTWPDVRVEVSDASGWHIDILWRWARGAGACELADFEKLC